MDALETLPPEPTEAPIIASPAPAEPIPRWLAAVEVFAVTGIPTGIVVFFGLLIAGVPMGADGTKLTVVNQSLEFFAMSALLDTALIALLIKLFLALSGEDSRRVFLGSRPIARELGTGLLLIPAALIVAFGTALILKYILPSLHNVEVNPFKAYMDTPLRGGVFIVVAMVGGGVREELQRAFVLHRFQRLGGMKVGWVIWSLVFGLLHVPQGFDAAIAVGALGFMWGWVYMRRRSFIAPLVSHAGFNALQVVAQVFAKL